jgi:glycosyltransferase involved in cell wall biosynthesis
VKVCIASELVGGVGVYAQNLIGGLEAQGHEVTVVTPQPAASKARRTVGVEQVGGRGRFLRQSAHLARGVRAVAREHDVVHVTDARFAVFMRGVPAEAPLVGTMNDDFYCGTRWRSWRDTRAMYADWRVRHLYYNVLRLGEARALPRYRRVICISSEVRRSLVRFHHMPPDRLDVVHYGIESPFEPLEGSGARPVTAAPLVLFAGGNFQRKGLDVLIDAAPEVVRRVQGVRFVVVGSSRDEQVMTQRAAERGVADRFDFVGQVPLAELHSLYGEAAAFAMPSKRESFGIPYLEAMHHRVPVVASDARGPSDFLCDGVNALCPPAGRPAPLAAALVRALTDDEVRSTLVAGGVATAERFTPSTMAAETALVYEAAVREWSP